MKKKTQARTKVAKLTKTSQNAISSVRKMIQQLKDTNDQVLKERIVNEGRIAQIQSDNQSLDLLKADNEKIISNFEALLN